MRVEERAVHLGPAGAAGHQAAEVGEEEAPALYGEEGCDGGDREVRAAAEEEEVVAEVSGRVPANLEI